MQELVVKDTQSLELLGRDRICEANTQIKCTLVAEIGFLATLTRVFVFNADPVLSAHDKWPPAHASFSPHFYSWYCYRALPCRLQDSPPLRSSSTTPV